MKSLKTWFFIRQLRVLVMFVAYQVRVSRQAAKAGQSIRQATSHSPFKDEVFMRKVHEVMSGRA